MKDFQDQVFVFGQEISIFLTGPLPVVNDGMDDRRVIGIIEEGTGDNFFLDFIVGNGRILHVMYDGILISYDDCIEMLILTVFIDDSKHFEMVDTGSFNIIKDKNQFLGSENRIFNLAQDEH